MASEGALVQNDATEALRLRDATIADLDGIAQLAISSFPDDPERDYRFPHRGQFPEDHWKWSRREYEIYLEQPAKFHIIVVEATNHSTQASKIVALCVWNLSNLTGLAEESPVVVLGEHERRDANLLHMRFFSSTLKDISKDRFGPFGTKQIILQNLCTHPDYRRRGCGVALCRWGMKKAEEKGYFVTVLGSPLGKLLYISVGFRVLAIDPLQVPGEDEMLDIATLVYDPRK